MTTSCTIKCCAIIFSITKTFTPMLRRHKRRTGQLGIPSKGHLVSINTLTSTSTSTLASGAADAVSEGGEVGIATAAAAAAVTAGQGRGGGSYCQFDCKYNCDGNDECSRWMEDGTGLVWPGSSWRCFLLSIVIVVVIVDPLTIFATSHLAESLCSTLRGQHQNLLV